MSEMETADISKRMFKKMFAENKRFDGRGLLDLREISIDYDVSDKAEGSARVKIGKTDVVVGVKLALGEPYPDSPDKGNLTVSCDLLPLASPRFEQGPPGFEAIELPRLVDRLIRESKIIDLQKLVIIEGEKVWTVFIDIYPINDDGSLIDASAIGALAALRSSKIPCLDKDNKIDYTKESKTPLPINKDMIPLSFSFYKLGDFILLDPTREEEEACDARITFGISKIKNEYFINSCQKGSEAMFSISEISTIMKTIVEKYEEACQKIKKLI